MSLELNAAGLEVNGLVTPGKPQTGVALCTTANTNYTTAPTNTVKVATAGAKGARLVKLRALPQGTVAACELQEFRKPTGAALKYFSNAVTMNAHTKVQTAAPPITDFGYSESTPKILAALEELYVAVGVSQNVAFEAEWQDFT